ncbi:hypothetical protein NCAS_0A08440 [Naumovozyma castellii]|uniref:asparagine--tRNA ligase n=1 Tax=Naumovozyma castellii TaxID=27288 RepID=G0V7F4_NAUCA|nr:hypothetical protein NCAS_0A08440 [Naumovozyma castellii CBS 4309]CCC67402.1 hypothetical protein NCAS_0A08440 [Naumovozyma castellii CBS 4309]
MLRSVTYRTYTTVATSISPISKTLSTAPTFDNIIKAIQNDTNNNEKSIPIINAWITSIRILKNVTFVDLNDSTTADPLRLVINNNINNEDTLHSIKRLNLGQSVSITNLQVQRTPDRQQAFEFKLQPTSQISIIGDIQPDYPLQKKNQSLTYLRSINPIFKHRTNYFKQQLKFRSFMEFQIHYFLMINNFIKVAPPIITGNDCEGANNELFKIKPTDAYLTVSAQLHLETLLNSTNKTWSLIPCFRAEKSNTNRHLLEFWMLELELAYIDDLEPLLDFIREFIIYLVKQCREHENDLLPRYYPNGVDDRETILTRWDSLIDPSKWNTVTYDDAIKKLQESGQDFVFKPTWGKALQSEHEKWLAESYFNGTPVFVTKYPKDCKAFYMKQTPENPETVECFDLLVPGMGEIIGGSLRENNSAKLESEMDRRGMNKRGELNWYIDLRKNGSVPHGGFGLGLERLISYLFGNHNIKDAIPFPRSADSQIKL